MTGEKRRVIVVDPGQDPRVVEIEPDGRGSYLHALQDLVGGHIEALPVLWGDEPLIWACEEQERGLGSANRAVYANAHMADVGYLSQLDYSTSVEVGDLYTIIYGTFVCARYGVDDELMDVSAEDWKHVSDAFGGPWGRISGPAEHMRILSAIADEEGRGRGRHR